MEKRMIKFGYKDLKRFIDACYDENGTKLRLEEDGIYHPHYLIPTVRGKMVEKKEGW